MQLLIVLLALLFILCIALTISMSSLTNRLRKVAVAAKCFAEDRDLAISKYNKLHVKYQDLLADEDYLLDKIDDLDSKVSLQDQIMDDYVSKTVDIAIINNRHRNIIQCVKTWWRS